MQESERESSNHIEAEGLIEPDCAFVLRCVRDVEVIGCNDDVSDLRIGKLCGSFRPRTGSAERQPCPRKS